MGKPIVEMKNIVKRFPGTVALKGVDFEIWPGEIHALLGENGAGKSTLIKILTGAYRPDEGEIVVEGKSYSYIPIKDLDRLGISVVYQDLKLAPGVSVMENILMGRLPKKAGLFIDRNKALQLANDALNRVGVSMDPLQLVGDLKAADQEIVAIAKALSKDAKLLILDEPTALLAADDVERLFEILRDLVVQGVSVLYISHRLEEIFAICDRVTVLRDGEKIFTRAIDDITREELIEAIAGQKQTTEDIYSPAPVRQELLRVEGLNKLPFFENISLQVKSGEVVGLFGLVGSGKSELLKGIFGAMPVDSGRVYLEGKEYRPKAPRTSINNGIGFVPEDRKTEGYLPRMPIYVNVNLPAYRLFAKTGWIYPAKEKNRALSVIDGFHVKYSSLDQPIDGLSGGNQQKVIIAKWIGSQVKVLLLDEPTAGIDVGARRDIFRVCRQLADKGKAVIYCSSYLTEIMEVADRILVMSRGRIIREFLRSDGFSEVELMKAAYN